MYEWWDSTMLMAVRLGRKGYLKERTVNLGGEGETGIKNGLELLSAWRWGLRDSSWKSGRVAGLGTKGRRCHCQQVGFSDRDGGSSRGEVASGQREMWAWGLGRCSA